MSKWTNEKECRKIGRGWELGLPKALHNDSHLKSRTHCFTQWTLMTQEGPMRVSHKQMHTQILCVPRRLDAFIENYTALIMCWMKREPRLLFSNTFLTFILLKLHPQALFPPSKEDWRQIRYRHQVYTEIWLIAGFINIYCQLFSGKVTWFVAYLLMNLWCSIMIWGNCSRLLN